MKIIEFSKTKSQELLAGRGVCFEDITPLIESGNVIQDIAHPNHKKFPHQRILYVQFKDYIYAVPYVEDKEKMFLKTIYPSRKAKKTFKENL